MSVDTLIIGAGMAGLSCARERHKAGASFLVLEASDGVGGRVRTDEVDGFLLDRGFQVLLTAYPDAKEILDYDALDLKAFVPGASVWTGDGFERIVDPWRQPGQLFSGLLARVGTFGDKLRMGRLRSAVKAGFGNGATTEAALRDYGFSDGMIERLFRPWFGGVFLDRSLNQPAAEFANTFSMFAAGDTVLPAKGMGAIPQQLADALPEGSIRLHAKVASLDENGVVLESGETIEAREVVVATDAVAASRLLGEPLPPRARGVRTVFFDAPHSPVGEGILVLDGEGTGPVNDLCVPSDVASGYAPAGRSLVSASVLDDVAASGTELEALVRAQLTRWFGEQVAAWRLLRIVETPHALPRAEPEPNMRVRPGLLVCGDHRQAASLQGAIASGRQAAAEISVCA